MRSRAFILIGVIVAMSAASSADAQSPWSAPLSVDGSQSSLGYSVSLNTADGAGALIAWSAVSGTTALSPGHGAAYLMTPLQVDTLRGVVTVPGDGVLAFGTGGSPFAEPPGYPASRTYVAEGHVGLPLEPAQALGVPKGRFLNAETSPNGAVAALQAACSGKSCSGSKVYVITRRVGAPGFGHPIAISGGRAAVYNADVGINDRGAFAVAWQQNNHLYARIRSAAGQLGPTELLGRAPGPTAIHVLMTPGGRTIVAWDGQCIDEGEICGPAIVQAAASKPPPSTHFATTQTLQVFRASNNLYLQAYIPARTIMLAEAAHRVVLAWTGYNQHLIVYAATLNGTGFGASEPISDTTRDSWLTDLAVGPEHELIALWTTVYGRLGGGPDSDHQQIVAAVARNRTGREVVFHRPEPVSGIGDNGWAPVGSTSFARVVINPVTDQALAVWLNASPTAHWDLQAALRIPVG